MQPAAFPQTTVCLAPAGRACPAPTGTTYYKRSSSWNSFPADSTLLNFLLRLEKKNFVRTEKQGNKNLYTPLVRRLTYCGAVSQAHLQTLYGGDIRAMVCALADTGRMTYADTERLLRWLTEYQAANPEYDYE